MKKTLTYLGISMALSFVFSTVYVIVMTFTLPKTDLAYGQMPFQDPLVFPIMLMVATVSGLIAWPLFATLGKHSPPRTVAKISGVATLIFILVVTPIQPIIGWIGSYIICLGALFYCSARHRNRSGQQITGADG